MAETEIMEKSGASVSIKCGFCHGTGKDPFGLLSILATCQVCGGRGKVTAIEPVVRCAFCNGSGVQPSRRLTCTVCNGKGVVPAPAQGEREVCPECGGEGRARGYLNGPCFKCKGRGFIAAKRLKGGD